MPANRQTGAACRRTLSGEQPDSVRVHAGPGYRAGVAGFAGRDFSGECRPLFRSAAQRSFPGSGPEDQPNGQFRLECLERRDLLVGRDLQHL